MEAFYTTNNKINDMSDAVIAIIKKDFSDIPEHDIVYLDEIHDFYRDIWMLFIFIKKNDVVEKHHYSFMDYGWTREDYKVSPYMYEGLVTERVERELFGRLTNPNLFEEIEDKYEYELPEVEEYWDEYQSSSEDEGYNDD